MSSHTRSTSRSRRRKPKSSEWATQPVNVSILPNLIGFNIRRAQIALWRDFGRTVGEGAIRPGMFSLLMLVEANPGIAQIDLATQLDMDKATIVGLIDSLQRRRWVLRRKSSVDRRRHGIFLTPAGRTGLEQLRREMLEHEAGCPVTQGLCPAGTILIIYKQLCHTRALPRIPRPHERRQDPSTPHSRAAGGR